MTEQFDLEDLKDRVAFARNAIGRMKVKGVDRRDLYGDVYAYWLMRKDQGASKRKVAHELGMKSHSMFIRWTKLHEKRLLKLFKSFAAHASALSQVADKK